MLSELSRVRFQAKAFAVGFVPLKERKMAASKLSEVLKMGVSKLYEVGFGVHGESCDRLGTRLRIDVTVT